MTYKWGPRTQTAAVPTVCNKIKLIIPVREAEAQSWPHFCGDSKEIFRGQK